MPVNEQLQQEIERIQAAMESMSDIENQIQKQMDLLNGRLDTIKQELENKEVYEALNETQKSIGKDVEAIRDDVTSLKDLDLNTEALATVRLTNNAFDKLEARGSILLANASEAFKLFFVELHANIIEKSLRHIDERHTKAVEEYTRLQEKHLAPKVEKLKEVNKSRTKMGLEPLPASYASLWMTGPERALLATYQARAEVLEDKHTKSLAELELAQATIDRIHLENDITRITALSVIDDKAVLSKHIENTQVLGENIILGHDFAAVREHIAMEKEIEEEPEQAPESVTLRMAETITRQLMENEPEIAVRKPLTKDPGIEDVAASEQALSKLEEGVRAASVPVTINAENNGPFMEIQLVPDEDGQIRYYDLTDPDRMELTRDEVLSYMSNDIDTLSQQIELQMEDNEIDHEDFDIFSTSIKETRKNIEQETLMESAGAMEARNVDMEKDEVDISLEKESA